MLLRSIAVRDGYITLRKVVVTNSITSSRDKRKLLRLHAWVNALNRPSSCLFLMSGGQFVK